MLRCEKENHNVLPPELLYEKSQKYHKNILPLHSTTTVIELAEHNVEPESAERNDEQELAKHNVEPESAERNDDQEAAMNPRC